MARAGYYRAWPSGSTAAPENKSSLCRATPVPRNGGLPSHARGEKTAAMLNFERRFKTVMTAIRHPLCSRLIAGTDVSVNRGSLGFRRASIANSEFRIPRFVP